MPRKKSIIIGAAVAVVALGGVGGASLASAATASNSGSDSIVDKIATTFNLNKADVKAVFEEDRAAKDAERKADQAERLAAAVKEGKLTQAQADYITKAQAEIASLRGSTKPGDETSDTRSQVKAKMDALRTWAKDNNVDAKYLGGPGGHGGPGGRGGQRGDKSDAPQQDRTSQQ